MDLWIWLLSAAVLVLVSASVMLLLRWFWPDGGQQRLASRLASPSASTLTETKPPTGGMERLPAGMRKTLARISRWSLPAPETPSTTRPVDRSAEDALPLQLQRAGWRSPNAYWVFGASKSVLALLGLALGGLLAWLLGRSLSGPSGWMLPVAAAACGYWLPDVWLRLRTAQRQQALFRAFPDALDMLRICVQAGLGLDAAIDRVGREMQLSSPVLSEEWRLTGLELRAGASRRRAMEHLAQRVNLREIDAMVTMLIQADRFGTRMAEALQVHADGLRTHRKQRAEASAAQLPVKLLFPLIFCIFPALLTVMLGPVALSLYEHFGTGG